MPHKEEEACAARWHGRPDLRVAVQRTGRNSMSQALSYRTYVLSSKGILTRRSDKSRSGIDYHPPVKALVIGASGLVGGALLRALRATGHEAVGTYRSRPATGLLHLEITDPTQVEQVIVDARPNVVFLTAALTAVDYCEDHEEEARAINVEAPRAIAHAAGQVSATVVFYSTEYVFDGTSGPYSEDHPISPRGVYAHSKADGESAVRETIRDHLILRTTVVFGWDRASKNFAMQVEERLSAGER